MRQPRNKTKRTNTFVSSFWEKVDIKRPDECWEWIACQGSGGYGSYRYSASHRIAYELHYGTHPGEMHVLHKCDNPPCCNPRHLFLGTRKDNMQDMLTKGRQGGGQPRGVDQGSAKLNDDQVREIRRRYQNGESQKGLARIYNVTQSAIFHIVHRNTWKHVLD